MSEQDQHRDLTAHGKPLHPRTEAHRAHLRAERMHESMVREMAQALVTAEWPKGLVKTIKPDRGKGAIKLLMQAGTPEERERATRFRGVPT